MENIVYRPSGISIETDASPQKLRHVEVSRTVEIVFDGGPLKRCVVLILKESGLLAFKEVLEEGFGGRPSVVIGETIVAFPGRDQSSVCVEIKDKDDRSVVMIDADMCWQLRRLLPASL